MDGGKPKEPKEPREPFLWRKTPDDLTPVEPPIIRRRSSRNLPAIGWVDCPACTKPGPSGAVVDHRTDCTLCEDPETGSFARKVPVDVAIEWRRTHPEEK